MFSASNFSLAVLTSAITTSNPLFSFWTLSNSACRPLFSRFKLSLSLVSRSFDFTRSSFWVFTSLFNVLRFVFLNSSSSFSCLNLSTCEDRAWMSSSASVNWDLYSSLSWAFVFASACAAFLSLSSVFSASVVASRLLCRFSIVDSCSIILPWTNLNSSNKRSASSFIDFICLFWCFISSFASFSCSFAPSLSALMLATCSLILRSSSSFLFKVDSAFVSFASINSFCLLAFSSSLLILSFSIRTLSFISFNSAFSAIKPEIFVSASAFACLSLSISFKAALFSSSTVPNLPFTTSNCRSNSSIFSFLVLISCFCWSLSFLNVFILSSNLRISSPKRDISFLVLSWSAFSSSSSPFWVSRSFSIKAIFSSDCAFCFKISSFMISNFDVTSVIIPVNLVISASAFSLASFVSFSSCSSVAIFSSCSLLPLLGFAFSVASSRSKVSTFLLRSSLISFASVSSFFRFLFSAFFDSKSSLTDAKSISVFSSVSWASLKVPWTCSSSSLFSTRCVITSCNWALTCFILLEKLASFSFSSCTCASSFSIFFIWVSFNSSNFATFLLAFSFNCLTSANCPSNSAILAACSLFPSPSLARASLSCFSRSFICTFNLSLCEVTSKSCVCNSKIFASFSLISLFEPLSSSSNCA